MREKTQRVYGTRGGSETSLNTVVRENAEVYINQRVEIILKFAEIFSKTAPSLYFYKLYLHIYQNL